MGPRSFETRGAYSVALLRARPPSLFRWGKDTARRRFIAPTLTRIPTSREYTWRAAGDGIRLQKASGACRGSEAASILKLRRKMDTTESGIVSSKLLQWTRGGWGNEAYTSKVARRSPARAAESVVRRRPARWAAVGVAEAVVRCRPARWAAVGGAKAVVRCRPARRTAVERRQPALADGRGARRFRVVGAPWGLERRRRWFDTRRGAARGPALRRQTSALRGLGDGHGRNLSSPRAHEVAADA